MKKQVFRNPDKGDPSDIQQIFTSVEIRLLCCRYWWQTSWEYYNLSYPFWRIYHNTKPGAFILFNGVEYEMTPEKFYLISPNTVFSSRLRNNSYLTEGYRNKGGRISNQTIFSDFRQDFIKHLFIHFNLGEIYDYVKPEIYEFEIDPIIQNKINEVITLTMDNPRDFDLYRTLLLQGIIIEALGRIPASDWIMHTFDTRILDTIRYVGNSLLDDLSNSALASRVNLATQSFYRLFKKETGTTVQSFVKKTRINKACDYLHHTSMSINEIAYLCGFSDRNHFSRIFKEFMNVPPALYRKLFISD